MPGCWQVLQLTPRKAPRSAGIAAKSASPITSKNRGKSGGARVITCVKMVGETICLLTVFDKADRANLTAGELDALFAEAGLVGDYPA